MTSMERVLCALGQKEADRVPFFLLLTMHGAKELGMSIREYFSSSANVIEGQLRLRKKYRHDCLYPFFYAAAEVEAWGGEVVFIENGPPNAGEPIIRNREQIDSMIAPQVAGNPALDKSLETIIGLKEKVGDDVPIIGIVISPFSVPVMQMGFEKYLDLIFEDRETFWKLMRLNIEFCVEWGNAQLAAGATAIVYFDPISSPSIIPPNLYHQTGKLIAQQTLPHIKGPTATHLASGRTLGIIPDVVETGSVMIGVSCDEDLADLKRAAEGKIALLGNLNGITMRDWTAEQAESEVKQAIAGAGQGGGFILSDTHGEIPWQVGDETLLAISDAVHKWGNYPLSWVNDRA